MGPYRNVLNLYVSIRTGGDFNDRVRLRQTYRNQTGTRNFAPFRVSPFRHNHPDDIVKLHEALLRRTVRALRG